MFSIIDHEIKVDLKKLGECELLNADETRFKAKELWSSGTAILVFLRHFACEACRLHALEVWSNRAQFQSKGVKICFIGNGAPSFINKFCKENGLDGASVVTDPSLASFRAAGFRKGFWIDPGEMYSRGKFLWGAIRLQMQKSQAGDVWQLGGIIGIDKNGKATYQFTSQALGDFPPTGDIPEISGSTASP